MDLNQIRNDFDGGMTHADICKKHSLTAEQVYAIIYVKSALSDEQIIERLKDVSVGLCSWQICKLMTTEISSNA